MSKKKTQFDRAIESFEADLVALRLTFESQRTALEAAISKLRAQQQSRPKRRPRATAEAEAPCKAEVAYATQPE